MFNIKGGFGYTGYKNQTLTTISKPNENFKTPFDVITNTSPFQCPTRTPSPNEIQLGSEKQAEMPSETIGSIASTRENSQNGLSFSSNSRISSRRNIQESSQNSFKQNNHFKTHDELGNILQSIGDAFLSIFTSLSSETSQIKTPSDDIFKIGKPSSIVFGSKSLNQHGTILYRF